MKNELKNMTKQELIKHFLQLKKPNQKQENVITKKEYDIARLNILVANLKRMLFGSKKERFISEKIEQLAFLFEEFASKEALEDETPVKEKITYEREKPSKNADRNKSQLFNTSINSFLIA